MKRQILFYIGFLPTLLFSIAATAGPEERGLEIAKSIKSKNFGWKSSQSNLLMVLRGKGKEITREMQSSSLEVDGDGDKSLLIFRTPLDVKGTSFLSFSHIVGQDDQWLYLPKLKRVKRIASRNKSGPFLGSEFAFEDISSFEVEKNTYKYLRDEVVNALDMHVVEMTPFDKYSGYSKMTVWVDSQEYRVHKIDFYDRRGELLKTQEFLEYKLFNEKYWRSQRQKMTNHKTLRSTDLIVSDLVLDAGLDDSDFTERKLSRGR